MRVGEVLYFGRGHLATMLRGLQKPLCRKHGVGTVHEDVYDSRGLQPGIQDEFPGTGRDRRHPIHWFI